MAVVACPTEISGAVLGAAAAVGAPATGSGAIPSSWSMLVRRSAAPVARASMTWVSWLLTWSDG